MRDQRAYIVLLCFGMLGAGYAGCGGGNVGVGGAGGAGDASTSSSSKSSSKSSSSSSGGPGSIGMACTADGDCGSGFTCAKPEDKNPVLFGGGPAGGYCTKSCTKDADCPLGSTTCLTDATNTNGICALTCQLGPALMSVNDPLDPTKCHGRVDVRCQALDMVTNACLPTCGKDSQCPAGRACDPRVGVCVDMASMGKPMGAKCNQMAMPPECAGICVGFGGMTTACSSRCVLGGMDIVNSPNCGGITSGLCAFPSSTPGTGVGDMGFCARACLKHDDCQNPTFWCQGITGLTGMAIQNGFCFPGNLACPNGQNDCTKGGTCTMTGNGAYCIDAQFPLGGMTDGGAPDGAPPDGGPGDGGPGDGGPGDGGPTDGGGGAGGGPVDAGSD